MIASKSLEMALVLATRTYILSRSTLLISRRTAPFQTWSGIKASLAMSALVNAIRMNFQVIRKREVTP